MGEGGREGGRGPALDSAKVLHACSLIFPPLVPS